MNELPVGMQLLTLAQDASQVVVPGMEGAGGTTAAPSGGADGATPPAGGGGGIDPMLMMLPLLAVLFIFMTIPAARRDKRQRKERQAMLDALGKHDKVMTTGGVIGTVVELRDDEVVLKVDENTNTRIKFSRTAIQQVIRANKSKSGGDADIEVKAGKEAASV